MTKMAYAVCANLIFYTIILSYSMMWCLVYIHSPSWKAFALFQCIYICNIFFIIRSETFIYIEIMDNGCVMLTHSICSPPHARTYIHTHTCMHFHTARILLLLFYCDMWRKMGEAMSKKEQGNDGLWKMEKRANRKTKCYDDDDDAHKF